MGSGIKRINGGREERRGKGKGINHVRATV
jgi:hypothetical protein